MSEDLSFSKADEIEKDDSTNNKAQASSVDSPSVEDQEHEASAPKKPKKLRKKRNAYQKIEDKIRIKLVESVYKYGETLKAAACRFGINYSSAKSILHTYRKEGRVYKKSTQEKLSKEPMMFDNIMARNYRYHLPYDGGFRRRNYPLYSSEYDYHPSMDYEYGDDHHFRKNPKEANGHNEPYIYEEEFRIPSELSPKRNMPENSMKKTPLQNDNLLNHVEDLPMRNHFDPFCENSIRFSEPDENFKELSNKDLGEEDFFESDSEHNIQNPNDSSFNNSIESAALDTFKMVADAQFLLCDALKKASVLNNLIMIQRSKE